MEFTNRQNFYAARLSPEGPYTPQMVVNEREQFVGSDDSEGGGRQKPKSHRGV
jgi:hypothetical protein